MWGMVWTHIVCGGTYVLIKKARRRGQFLEELSKDRKQKGGGRADSQAKPYRLESLFWVQDSGGSRGSDQLSTNHHGASLRLEPGGKTNRTKCPSV
jgi:hypothetical protein